MAESASALIAVSQLGSDWQYTITLDDTGSTPIGTFWFAWVPGEDFLASSPSSVFNPSAWNNTITHGGSGDGYAIQFAATSPSNDLQPGDSIGFSFVSSDSPSSIFGNSVFYPSTPVTTSFVYSGASFSDAGFEFQATELVTSPTVTVETAGGIDLRWATLYNEMANSPIGAGGTATQYTCVDSGQFNGQSAPIKFVVSGSGESGSAFTYSGSFPNIQLTGGIISSVQEEDTSNNVLATIAGLSIMATDFNSAMASYVAGGANPDPTALNALFLSLAYTVNGGAGSDKLQGGNLDDTIIGSTGNDSIDGGGGANTVDYSSLTSPGLFAIIQGGGGTVNKGGANGADTLTNAQDIVDHGTGRGNGDVFEVDAGENVMANFANFDYLIELSAGVSVQEGISFSGITEFVSNTGTNTVDFSTDPHFAYLYGSTGDDTLTLGSGGGYMFGEGGTNVLNGGVNGTYLFVGGDGGSDTMNGGTGTASNFYFVDGNDQVNGAGAFNVMIELVSGVTVQLGSAQYQDVQEFVADGGTNAVTVANTDSDFVYLYGGAGNDTLSTGSGGGYLFGEGGTNVLTGGGGLNVFVADGASGADTMNGGSGSNIYYIDANSIVNGAGTFNTVIELQQNATLTLGSAQLGTDVQQVILNGGTNIADFHTATSSVFLYGGSGNDTLFGGTGNDFLYGGTGTNTFKFASGWGQDTIEDWTAGTNNIIDLTALAGSGVHAITDLTQTITSGHDVITSSHTGTNSITLLGVGSALTAGSFHFA
jgi:Ca2+-binding RTX toxin-like protein